MTMTAAFRALRRPNLAARALERGRLRNAAIAEKLQERAKMRISDNQGKFLEKLNGAGLLKGRRDVYSQAMRNRMHASGWIKPSEAGGFWVITDAGKDALNQWRAGKGL